MQWCTRSRPTDPCRPVANATASLVPTPSAEATSTGSLNPLTGIRKKAAKGPLVREHIAGVRLTHHLLDLGQRPVLSVNVDA